MEGNKKQCLLSRFVVVGFILCIPVLPLSARRIRNARYIELVQAYVTIVCIEHEMLSEIERERKKVGVITPEEEFGIVSEYVERLLPLYNRVAPSRFQMDLVTAMSQRYPVEHMRIIVHREVIKERSRLGLGRTGIFFDGLYYSKEARESYQRIYGIKLGVMGRDLFIILSSCPEEREEALDLGRRLVEKSPSHLEVRKYSGDFPPEIRAMLEPEIPSEVVVLLIHPGIEGSILGSVASAICCFKRK